MADIAIFRINYKSDFILTLNSDAGWLTPFCIKFWTGSPLQAYYAGYDGTDYTHCAPVDGEPTMLRVQFDDHHLPIGDLKFQIGYHFTVADFPTSVEDEVLNQASVIIEVDDAPAQVMLDLNGETAPEIQFTLPAYTNEQQRIANEEQRIAHEAIRIVNEESRIAAETIRQQNEAQRISNEESRVTEFDRLKSESEAATIDANAAATLANAKAALAADKAALADAAATLANEKAQLATDKAALADAAATLANDKAALAQQKADYAQTQGDYAKQQGDYAKAQSETAQADHSRAEGDHTRAESDHSTASADHTQAGNDHTRAESDHGIAVDDHTQAGTDHTRAESDHGIAVDDHTQAGTDHQTAQSDHTIAGNDHTQAGSDHTRAESDHTRAEADHARAESDHGIAVDDHTQAGTDHQTAQSDHTIAGNDHTQAGSDHTRAESDHTRAEADHAAVEVYVDSLGAFDISAYHATGGVLAKYADLTAALGTNGTNIPDAIRKGGMSVKYVNSSDSKYVQWRYMGTSITDADFTNVANWQCIEEQVAANTEAITNLQNIVDDLVTIAEGYVRVAGSSSPVLSYQSYEYYVQKSVFSLFYPCLVGTPLTGSGTEGKVLHVLQKFGARTIDGSPKWLDIYGTPHAIDGSEGDVMIVNIEPFYSINGKHTIEGTEYDVFLMSRTPFTWKGIEAEHMEKFGWSPDYCVSHWDTDNVLRMHSVYNPAWNGSYTASVGVAGKYVYSVDPETGDIVETYDANETLLGGAGGLHSTDIDLPTGEQRAMNNNADTTKTVPWMNQTAEGCNRLMSLILAEGGTFDAHNANLMGSGFTSNDGATDAGDWEQAGSGAKNGLRVMDKNGAWKYYSFTGNISFLKGATSGMLEASNVINGYRSPWHILEAHRAMSYAIENDVHELEWFVFEGNKYKYRSVQGFKGPSHGEMTCVVWKLMATQAGAYAIDPNDNATSIAGNRVEILVSTALVHGMTTQVSPSWWTSGLLFTEDENGQYECYMERDQAELVKGIAADNYDPATPRDFETIYDHVLTVQKGEGYAKNYLNGALMLPDSNANKTGAGLHTYVGKCNWFTGENASAGKKSVRGFRRGVSAFRTNMSLLSMFASSSPSLSYASFGFGTCCQIVD